MYVNWWIEMVLVW